LSRTRFLTYITAKYGAIPASVAVDTQGNILVAGTTSSPGYPTTPDSYLPIYTAASGMIETCGPPIPLEFTSPSGYVTLLKSDGTGLIFSTFFSGSRSDTIGFAALTSAGIYIAGQASSVGLPGFEGAVPLPCVPVGFVTCMTLDGSAISSTRTPPGTPLAYDSASETLLLVSGSDLIRFDSSAATPIACVLDAADLSRVTAVAPGELLSMFGRFLYFETNPFAVTIQPNGSFPVSSQGLGVRPSVARRQADCGGMDGRPYSHSINATRLMWAFFHEHRLTGK
jgi:Beta-propeller repeat